MTAKKHSNSSRSVEFNAEVLGIVPLKEIPPASKLEQVYVPHRLRFFINSALHMPHGWALKISHNLGSAQTVHERIKGCANRLGMSVRVAVRDRYAYISPVDDAEEPARRFVESLLREAREADSYLCFEKIHEELDRRFGKMSVLTVRALIEAIKCDGPFEVREICDGDGTLYAPGTERDHSYSRRI